MADLHLHLKFEYWDAIASGEKTEEYREVNEYWKKRLDGRRRYKNIVLHRGYTKERLVLPWRGFQRKIIKHPHFGEDFVLVFAIDVMP